MPFSRYGGGCLVDVDGTIVNPGEGFLGRRLLRRLLLGESDKLADASGLLHQVLLRGGRLAAQTRDVGDVPTLVEVIHDIGVIVAGVHALALRDGGEIGEEVAAGSRLVLAFSAATNDPSTLPPTPVQLGSTPRRT